MLVLPDRGPANRVEADPRACGIYLVPVVPVLVPGTDSVTVFTVPGTGNITYGSYGKECSTLPLRFRGIILSLEHEYFGHAKGYTR